MFCMPIAKRYRVVGFLFNDRRELDDPEAYFDFETLTWSKDELMSDLKQGNLPIGSLVLYPDYRIRVVARERGNHKLISLDDIMSLYMAYSKNER